MRRQILIVDDSKLQCLLTQQYITDAGYDAHIATGGYEASNLLKKKLYDLVLTDIEMPNIDGIELLRHISEICPGQAVGIISSKGHSVLNATGELAKLHNLKIMGVFEKPLNGDMFKACLHEHFTQPSKPEDQQAGPSDSKKAPMLDVASIKEGLEQGAIDILYQPKVDCASLEIVGYESLARWKNEDGTYLGPASFIPIAEDNGLMDLLTDKVIEKVVLQAEQWQDQGFKKKLSINISVHNLSTLKFPDKLSAFVKEHSLRPEDFIFELTETKDMTDWTSCLEILTRLRLAGFGLSIDDFGTGYASFDRLNHLPFTEIKLDRSYVSSAEDNESALAMAQTVVDVAKRFNVTCVAEGVETQSQYKLMHELGVDIIQGFYFARPMDASVAKDYAQTTRLKPSGIEKHRT